MVRYELVSHACLSFDFDGYKIITDPWLLGSCHYRSWWHVPKPSKSIEDFASVNAIVISHMHPDHFHMPSMRKFPKQIPVYIPKLFFSDFYDGLKQLGFENVIEIEHGKTISLDNGVKITNYQYRADDSTFVFDYQGKSWIHFNDCLVRGKTLKTIMERHPHIHTIFKIYANAEPYPYCYESEDEKELKNWDNNTIVDSFLDSVKVLRPEYAVPYAGFVSIYHKNGSYVNDMIALPTDIIDRGKSRNQDVSNVKLMSPGDTWSSEEGFKLSGKILEPRQDLIKERYPDLEERLEKHYQQETPQEDLWDCVREYFEGYFKNVPRLVRKKVSLKVKLKPTDLNEAYLLDVFRGTLQKCDPNEEADVEASMTSFLMKKAVTQYQWGIVVSSYQVRYRIKAGVRSAEALFWVSLFLYDFGYFSLKKILRLRTLGVLWNRRDEFWEYFCDALTGRFVERQLQEKFEGISESEDKKEFQLQGSVEK